MGYVRPTNFELIKQADTIVLAKAESFEKKGNLKKGKSYGIFKFRVLETIKDNLKEKFFTTEGDDDVCSWGSPDDFSYNKSDHGPCNATEYEVGHNYVLLLRNWKGDWSVDGPPFTRVNVEVDGANASWTKAVRQYVRVASLNDYEKEKVALRDLRFRALTNDLECPAALVKDIDAHFKKPTPAKNFLDLKSLYEQTTDSKTREMVLWACAHGEKAEAKDFFRQLMKENEWKQYLYPVCSYISRAKLMGFHEPIAAALADHNNEHERRMLLVALSGTADTQQQAFMQRVLQTVDNKEAAILSAWFVQHPSQEAIKHFTSLASKDYAESDLTFALAAMGDTNVLKWAEEFAKKPNERDWVSYYVYARSPLPQADALARKVIRNGDSDGLVSLVEGYGDSENEQRLDRLKEIAALETKSRKLIYWLRRALGDMAYKGNKQAELLLSQLPVVDSDK